MRRVLGAALVLALVVSAQPARAGEIEDARRQASLQRQTFSNLLAVYRDASIAADEAIAAWLALRVKVEEARADADAARSALARAATTIYINGTGTVAEVILASRSYSDLATALPFAHAAIREMRRASRDVDARRTRVDALQAQARAAEAVALNGRASRATVLAEIHARLSDAEAAFRTAVAHAAAAAALVRVHDLGSSFASVRDQVERALAARRRSRGEAAYRAAAPYLGPRANCDVPTGLRPTGENLDGMASWYGNEFAGENTASGAVYDPRRYTVAHKTLPLHVFLLIRDEGRCVVAFLNDRGPYVANRILDLSAGSARAVDLTGVEAVTAQVLVRS